MILPAPGLQRGVPGPSAQPKAFLRGLPPHRQRQGPHRGAGRAGALSEAIERYSALYRGDEGRVHARLSELGSDAVHPHALQCFSAAQYQQRQAVRPWEEPRRAVPLPYDNDAPIELDTRLVADARPPPLTCPPRTATSTRRPRWRSRSATSTRTETRPATAWRRPSFKGSWSWWSAMRWRCGGTTASAGPGVDLQSFGEPDFLALQSYYSAWGAALGAGHHARLGLPAFVAVARVSGPGPLCAGFGAHFDARLAVQRALTEVNQCLNPRDLTNSPGRPRSWGTPRSCSQRSPRCARAETTRNARRGFTGRRAVLRGARGAGGARDAGA